MKDNVMENLLYKVEEIPIFQNKVCDSFEQAIDVQRGSVELVYDSKSCLIHNKIFDQKLMNYDENYQNEQGNSLYFRNYLNDLIKQMLGFGIHNKKVIEIGCGKGLFLEMLREKGCNVMGFDPTYEGEKPYIIKEYFSRESNDVNGDFIFLRHTLEHIPNPLSFITEIAEANAGCGEIFIEVPTFDWIVENKAFFDIFYEHVNYFTELSLSSMFHKSTTGRLFNGQYIFIHADLKDLKKSPIDFTKSTPKYNVDFDHQIEEWRSVIKKYDRVYIWGAGAKGSTFLNRIDPNRMLVDSVIDINPRKQNKYLGGSGHPIISPDKISVVGKTLIIIMNKNYQKEISEQLKNYDVSILSM